MPSIPAGRTPSEPGADGTPGDGPTLPPGAVPTPPTGEINVSAPELQRYSELFARTGQQVEAVRSRLDSTLTSLETGIGDDETGASFKKEYLPARTNVMTFLQNLTLFLDGVQEGLAVTAQNYVTGDEVADDGVQQLHNG